MQMPIWAILFHLFTIMTLMHGFVCSSTLFDYDSNVYLDLHGREKVLGIISVDKRTFLDSGLVVTRVWMMFDVMTKEVTLVVHVYIYIPVHTDQAIGSWINPYSLELLSASLCFTVVLKVQVMWYFDQSYSLEFVDLRVQIY
jgi:hypothetical protein